jgi:hypothetical protein
MPPKQGANWLPKEDKKLAKSWLKILRDAIRLTVVLKGRQTVSCTGELIFLLIYVSPVNFSFPGFKMGPYTEVNSKILSDLSKTQKKKPTIRLGAFRSRS